MNKSLEKFLWITFACLVVADLVAFYPNMINMINSDWGSDKLQISEELHYGLAFLNGIVIFPLAILDIIKR